LAVELQKARKAIEAGGVVPFRTQTAISLYEGAADKKRVVHVLEFIRDSDEGRPMQQVQQQGAVHLTTFYKAGDPPPSRTSRRLHVRLWAKNRRRAAERAPA
jgi:hypothetical protein